MAGKLVLIFNDETIGEFPLDRESVMIGRRPTCDVHIDNLAVSGSHARVLTILSDSFLEDLESTNGTFVNGKRIKKHALVAGDVITIGKHQLRFVADARQGAEAEEGMLDPASNPLGGPPSTGETTATARAARLRVLTDQGPGKELPLTKALTTIGKPGVQVAAISRRHQGDFLVHVDGGPANDRVPVINGSPIGFKSHLLRHQDVIEIAGVRMEYLIDG